jgi:hypothetical protein
VSVKAILEKSTVDYVDSSRAATSSVLGARPRAPGARALPPRHSQGMPGAADSRDLWRGRGAWVRRGAARRAAAPRPPAATRAQTALPGAGSAAGRGRRTASRGGRCACCWSVIPPVSPAATRPARPRARPRVQPGPSAPATCPSGPLTPAATPPPPPPAAIILGGGAGTRLYPLTKQRAKPAVPIGGAYRLIDVPMSNCINSGISKVGGWGGWGVGWVGGTA